MEEKGREWKAESLALRVARFLRFSMTFPLSDPRVESSLKALAENLDSWLSIHPIHKNLIISTDGNK